MTLLGPADVARLAAHMRPQSSEVVLLVFVRQIDGSYLLAAPVAMSWPDVMAAVSHVQGIIPTKGGT